MNYFSMYTKVIPVHNNYFIVSVKVLYDNMFYNVSEKILMLYINDTCLQCDFNYITCT